MYGKKDEEEPPDREESTVDKKAIGPKQAKAKKDKK